MAAADVVGRMRVEIVGDNSRLDRSINDSRNSANNLGKTLKNMFKGIAVAAAIRAIAKVTTSLINAASDAEETRNKFEVVFGTVADAAKEAADRIKEEFKLSDETTEKFLSGVGDITSGLGATGEEALLAAEKITKLGLDIDSFANLSGGAEQAIKALTSLFTQEREAAKALGIVINDNNLKQFAEDSGLVFKNLTPLEKGFLSLELATSQSQLAIGDFTRSIGSFANQQKIAKSAVQDLQVAIGKNLLPAATDAIGIFGTLTTKITEFIEEHNKLQEVVGRFKADTDTAEDVVFIAQRELNIVRDRLALKKEELENLVVMSLRDESRKQDLETQVELLKSQVRTASEIVSAASKIVKEEQKIVNAKREGDKLAQEAAENESERLKALAADTMFRIKVQNELKETVDKINEAVIGGLIVGNGELEKEEALRAALLELIDAGFTAQGQGFENVIEFAKLLNIELEKEVEIIEFVNKRYQDSLDENQFAHRSFTESILEDNEEIELSTLETWAVIGSAITNALSSIDVIADNFASAELQRLEDSGASQDQLDKAKRKFAREDAIRQKASAIASIGFNTPAAIVNALTAGPILGPILAAIIGGLAAVQLVSVISAPLPAFAQGGIVSGTPSRIDNRIAKVASGELIANQDQKDRMLMEFLNGGGSGGGTTIINAVIDKKVLFKVILDGSRQGTAQFASRGVIN